MKHLLTLIIFVSSIFTLSAQITLTRDVLIARDSVIIGGVVLDSSKTASLVGIAEQNVGYFYYVFGESHTQAVAVDFAELLELSGLITDELTSIDSLIKLTVDSLTVQTGGDGLYRIDLRSQTGSSEDQAVNQIHLKINDSTVYSVLAEEIVSAGLLKPLGSGLNAVVSLSEGDGIAFYIESDTQSNMRLTNFFLYIEKLE